VVCARYRDVEQLVASGLQIALFATPIFFAPEQLGPRFGRLVDYNVFYHAVEIVRGPLLGRAPDVWSWGVTVFVLIAGWTLTLWFYGRFRRRVPYWL
jgi:lipopolysaccharide transport system permease protein